MRISHTLFPALTTLLFTACPGAPAQTPEGSTGTGTTGTSNGTDSASSVTDAPTTTATPTTGTSTTDTSTTDTSTTTSTSTSSSTTEVGSDTTSLPKLDLPDNPDPPPDCAQRGTCALLDVLFVIDNSATTGEEQRSLAAAVPFLVQQLRDLEDSQGNPRNLDVNLMVTTTDFGHPLCTPLQQPGYTPAKGAPIATACTERINDFEPVGDGPAFPQACTDRCDKGNAAVPSGPFIHFDSVSDNVKDPDGIGDPVADALACILPQGINGCGMEAPLETMLQALDPGKVWNTGSQPFLRDDAPLVVVILTDEEDCSVKNYQYFDPSNKNDPEFNKYWEDLPGKPGVKGPPTSAVCWNAGTTCIDGNNDKVYESCEPVDNGVLQPIERYTSYLKDVLGGNKGKQVIMLGMFGVPVVTQHNPNPPFQPTDGGLFDLVYRDWLPSDILPADPDTAAEKQQEFGIGPGCTNAVNGQAIPPSRLRAVCEGLDRADDPNTPEDETARRCCIESVCDGDYTSAISCLTGMLDPTNL